MRSPTSIVSHLLNTRTLSCTAPIASSVSFTISIFRSISASPASITCKIRSDSMESSRVEEKAAINSGGRSRINPMVSFTRNSYPLQASSGTNTFPTDVPSVAKSLSSASTPLWVRAVKRVDFPALVYPTIPAVGSPCRFLRFLCSARVRV